MRIAKTMKFITTNNLEIDSMIQLLERASTPDERVRLQCALAKKLEDAGEYEEGRIMLEDVWKRVGERPQLKGLDNQTRGLLLLRSGVLTGWLGSTYQLPNAQEKAKDLISESGAIFETLGLSLDAIEAQYEIALCYWREGAFDEARVILRSALERLNAESSNIIHNQSTSIMAATIYGEELRGKLLLRASVVEFRAQRFDVSLRLLEESRPLVEAHGDDLLKGKFHAELATTLKNLAVTPSLNKQPSHVVQSQQGINFDRALIEFAAAAFYFEQAGHARYCARVENNLAMLHLQLKRYEEAHAHLDRALKLFAELQDSGSTAQVRETCARVFLAEGRHVEAERMVSLAVRQLEGGGEQSLLAEALVTHGTVLCRLNNFTAAEDAFTRALTVAEAAGDTDGAGRAALSLIEELSQHIPFSRVCELYQYADDVLFKSNNVETVGKLRSCARFVIGKARVKTKHFANKSEDGQPSSLHFYDEVNSFEARLIQTALKATENRITQAAKMLDLSHQNLSRMLKTRHQALLKSIHETDASFKVRKRRRQHIIKDHIKPAKAH